MGFRNVLGFGPDENFTERDVILRYKRLARTRHPNKDGSNAAFQELGQAKMNALEFLEKKKKTNGPKKSNSGPGPKKSNDGFFARFFKRRTQPAPKTSTTEGTQTNNNRPKASTQTSPPPKKTNGGTQTSPPPPTGTSNLPKNWFDVLGLNRTKHFTRQNVENAKQRLPRSNTVNKAVKSAMNYIASHDEYRKQREIQNKKMRQQRNWAFKANQAKATPAEKQQILALVWETKNNHNEKWYNVKEIFNQIKARHDAEIAERNQKPPPPQPKEEKKKNNNNRSWYSRYKNAESRFTQKLPAEYLKRVRRINDEIERLERNKRNIAYKRRLLTNSNRDKSEKEYLNKKLEKIEEVLRKAKNERDRETRLF